MPVKQEVEVTVGKFLEEAFELCRCFEDEHLKSLLRNPQLKIAVEIPLRRDDGRVSVFKGYRVQHNSARGPFKGGLRFHPTSDMEHFELLASLMTWKTALANIPFGGGKGGIHCDPKELSTRELEALTKRFTEKIHLLIGPELDIPGPDIGSGEREMGWMFEAYSRIHGYKPGVVTGKNTQIGGIVGRRESTGQGVAMMAGWGCEELGIDVEGATFAIQGFGNVGSVAAQALYRRGGKLVAITDASGGLYDERGLEVDRILELQKGRGNEQTFHLSEIADQLPGAELISSDAALFSNVDVLIPCAVEAVIDADNVASVTAKLIVEGANLPITYDADVELRKRGTMVIPDIAANAGGVIVSFLEWSQNHQHLRWSEDQVREELTAHLRRVWESLLQETKRRKCSFRQAAYTIAVMRVKEAIDIRGF